MLLNMRRINGPMNTPLPKRSTELAAGYDLFTPNQVVIRSGCQLLVPLGIVWDPPKIEPQWLGSNYLVGGFFAKIFDRSGLALKKRFSTLAGVIDQDYLNEWGLVCRNEGEYDFYAEPGDKIAQFVLLPFLLAEDLENGYTETRSGGFGSTGN